MITINETLVKQLIITQFPQWKDFPIKPVAISGWDNRTFHLGNQMLVRMPSAACYAANIEKEFHWLPILAPLLPLKISTPLVMGKPGNGYPWHWSVYRWIEGETAAIGPITNLIDFAKSLAQFLVAFQSIDPTNGPQPGQRNFHRGGSLINYDNQARQALTLLKDKIDSKIAIEVWDSALATTWQNAPVWVHGDISTGNLLVQNGQLTAVIDFGGLAVGDPACDLAIAWTLFKDESRNIFRSTLQLDEGTWARGRAWILWKALIVAAGLTNTNAPEAQHAWHIIDEVLVDHNPPSSR